MDKGIVDVRVVLICTYGGRVYKSSQRASYNAESNDEVKEVLNKKGYLEVEFLKHYTEDMAWSGSKIMVGSSSIEKGSVFDITEELKRIVRLTEFEPDKLRVVIENYIEPGVPLMIANDIGVQVDMYASLGDTQNSGMGLLYAFRVLRDYRFTWVSSVANPLHAWLLGELVEEVLIAPEAMLLMEDALASDSNNEEDGDAAKRLYSTCGEINVAQYGRRRLMKTISKRKVLRDCFHIYKWTSDRHEYYKNIRRGKVNVVATISGQISPQIFAAVKNDRLVCTDCEYQVLAVEYMRPMAAYIRSIRECLSLGQKMIREEAVRKNGVALSYRSKVGFMASLCRLPSEMLEGMRLRVSFEEGLVVAKDVDEYLCESLAWVFRLAPILPAFNVRLMNVSGKEESMFKVICRQIPHYKTDTKTSRIAIRIDRRKSMISQGGTRIWLGVKVLSYDIEIRLSQFIEVLLRIWSRVALAYNEE